jgi:hypothetical protein
MVRTLFPYVAAVTLGAVYAFFGIYLVTGAVLPYGCDLGPIDTVMLRVGECR